MNTYHTRSLDWEIDADESQCEYHAGIETTQIISKPLVFSDIVEIVLCVCNAYLAAKFYQILIDFLTSAPFNF